MASQRITPPRRSTVAPAAAASLPTPPEMPAKTGVRRSPAPAGDSASVAAAAASNDPCFRSPSVTCGHAASNDSSWQRPAYTPPTSGSTSRSVTSLPSRRLTSAPMDMSCERSTGANRGSRRARNTPARLRIPDRAAAFRSAGTPINVGGNRWMPPRVQTPASATTGCTMSSARPTSAANAVPSLRRASMDSAPRSTCTPATSPAAACRRPRGSLRAP